MEPPNNDTHEHGEHAHDHDQRHWRHRDIAYAMLFEGTSIYIPSDSGVSDKV